MARRGRGARIKGANFEREIAKVLSEATKEEFKRGLGQSRLGGSEIADIYCEKFPQLHFELKNQKRCNIRAALDQAIEDSPEKLKVVITKDTRADILVTMTFEDWIEFFNIYLKEVKNAPRPSRSKKSVGEPTPNSDTAKDR